MTRGDINNAILSSLGDSIQGMANAEDMISEAFGQWFQGLVQQSSQMQSVNGASQMQSVNGAPQMQSAPVPPSASQGQ
jgi:hypothetical protein